jgi:hypothetical protein
MDEGQYPQWADYPTAFTWRIDEGEIYGWSASPIDVSLESGEHTFHMFSEYDGWYGASVMLKTPGGDIVAEPYTLMSGSDDAVTFTFTAAPTASPTNTGDTHTPTASPTDAPTATPYSDCAPPTPAPTAAPTPVRQVLFRLRSHLLLLPILPLQHRRRHLPQLRHPCCDVTLTSTTLVLTDDVSVDGSGYSVAEQLTVRDQTGWERSLLCSKLRQWTTQAEQRDWRRDQAVSTKESYATQRPPFPLSRFTTKI